MAFRGRQMVYGGARGIGGLRGQFQQPPNIAPGMPPVTPYVQPQGIATASFADQLRHMEELARRYRAGQPPGQIPPGIGGPNIAPSMPPGIGGPNIAPGMPPGIGGPNIAPSMPPVRGLVRALRGEIIQGDILQSEYSWEELNLTEEEEDNE